MTPEQLKLIRDTLEQVQSIIESTYGHDENEDGTNGARNDESSDYSSSDIVEFLCEIEKSVDESLAVLKSIQTPPVPETPASGHEWRIVWVHFDAESRYGSFSIHAETEHAAIRAAMGKIEREHSIRLPQYTIARCELIRAVLTNGEIDETFEGTKNP